MGLDLALSLFLSGLVLQLALGALLLNVPPVRATFFLLGDAVDSLATATRAGTSLVFGYLGGGALPFTENRPGASGQSSEPPPGRTPSNDPSTVPRAIGPTD